MKRDPSRAAGRRRAAGSGSRGRGTGAGRKAVLAPILAYRRFLSPVMPARCKYHPSCSRYAVEAIERHGAARGLVLAGWRLLRCNPFSHGGHDPVSAQTLFQGPRRRPSAPHAS